MMKNDDDDEDCYSLLPSLSIVGTAKVRRGHVAMATPPPAEADLFNSFIMTTYGRYPITMVK